MGMTGFRCSMFVVVLMFLQSLARGDTEVSCVFMESCILPCSFQAGYDPLIHWIQETGGDTHVHSYYHNQDQFENQGQRFKGRTSMSKDQISRGDASLQLRAVTVQDQGRYKCHTSTTSGKKESFINLNVDSPVHAVNIERVGNRVTCSSEGIYPEPELTWSTSPPSNMSSQNTTTVQKTEQQLYNINSSLTLPDSTTDLVTKCTVSTRSNRKTAGVLITGHSPNVEMQLNRRTVRVFGAVVILFLAVIIGLGVLCICKRRKKKDQTETGHTDNRQPISPEHSEPPETDQLNRITDNGEPN